MNKILAIFHNYLGLYLLDIIQILSVFLILYLTRRFKFGSRMTALTAFILLFFTMVFNVFHQDYIAGIMSEFVWIMFGVAFIQSLNRKYASADDYYLSKLKFFLKIIIKNIYRTVMWSVIFIWRHPIQIIIIILLTVSGVTIYKSGIKYIDYHTQIPEITGYEPKILYSGNKVLIKGKYFQQKAFTGPTVKSDRGELAIIEKHDNLIVARIPDNWDKGEVKIWIEKTIKWEERIINTATKPVIISIFVIGKTSKEERDEYFSQYKFLSKEAIEYNR
jgi:hypothetical protein